MKRIAGRPLAFCTFCFVVLISNRLAAVPPKLGEDFAQYNRAQIQWGATTLPLGAQLTYRAAEHAIQNGDLDLAVRYLEEAIKLDPQFSDAYFTLSKVKCRKLDPDALYLFVMGFRVVLGRFSSQSLLAVNAIVLGALVLMVLTMIVCMSFAIRYLPFLAHKIAEFLRRRLNAALPRATSYLLVLLPFALFPGFVSGICVLVLTTWYFMQRREKFMLLVLMLPFVLWGVFSPRLRQFDALADPESFTQLAARSAYAPSDPMLINAVEQMSVKGLEAERHDVLGLLYTRREDYETAAWHFLRAIEIAPRDASAYINLGNVYYMQGRNEKALEGYHKAAQIDETDAVGQYNLAQAYIRTLLMAESSKALKNAAAAGIDEVRSSYAAMAQSSLQVYPKTYSAAELWRFARIEGKARTTDFLSDMLQPLTRFPARVSAWLLACAAVLAMIISRILRNRGLTFQCSNCGNLTCDGCCADNGDTLLCPNCAAVIEGVSSDKVTEALLRQRRQSVIVRRRRAIRLLTLWLPGMRDVYYGRLSRGLLLALLFSFAAVELWTRGYILKDWNSLPASPPVWKWVLPSIVVTFTYSVSWFSRRYVEVRNYRSQTMRARKKDANKEDGASLRTASAQ